MTLLGDVASTYVGIRTLEKQIAIARENVVEQREVFAIARDSYRAARPPCSTFIKRKMCLGATEATVPQLTIQLQQGLNALRVLLGMAPEPLGFLLARSTGHIPVNPEEGRRRHSRGFAAPAGLTFARPN